MRVHHRSPRRVARTADTNDRRTPRWFFQACQARFGRFDLDAAASAANALCPVFIDQAQDALAVVWAHVSCRVKQVWANPPYGPPGTIERWIAKARQERDDHGIRTLLLLPADTSTRWYRDVAKTELTELVPFRLAFEAPDGSTEGNSAKFGSVLVWIAPRIVQPDRARVGAAK
jgi:phage N-6-adenine-methyltransferase